MTTGRRATWMTAAWLAVFVAVAIVPMAAGTTRAGEVTITAKYSGKGTVDSTHRIWVWLFDTPDIGPGAMPVAEASIDKNGGAASFTGVTAERVWVAVAFDEQGGFGGMAPPPSGAPVSIYMAGGAPAPIVPGDAGRATITFDDTQRMP